MSDHVAAYDAQSMETMGRDRRVMQWLPLSQGRFDAPRGRRNRRPLGGQAMVEL